MSKKAITITLCSVLAAIIAIVTIFGGIIISRNIQASKNNFAYLNNACDKVVLFIGDGMGENHIKAAESYLSHELFFDDFATNGYVSTFSNAVLVPTDSAAAATALATGKKVNNREVAQHHNQALKSISEYAKAKNKGVGIVTTDSLCGATPAGFSAHASDRSNTEEIITSQLNSGIDLFLGAGLSTYTDYRAQFESKNFTFATTYSSLSTASERLIGVYDKISNYTGTDTSPTLSELTDFAIDYMDTKYPSGYFLMVEGAHIDKMSHDNDIIKMIEYLDEFDNAIELAHTKMQSTTSYSIIVTADHETGGLRYNGETAEQITDSLYTRGGHSSADVKYYIDWRLREENTTPLPTKIDNTDIFKITHALLCG